MIVIDETAGSSQPTVWMTPMTIAVTRKYDDELLRAPVLDIKMLNRFFEMPYGSGDLNVIYGHTFGQREEHESDCVFDVTVIGEAGFGLVCSPNGSASARPRRS